MVTPRKPTPVTTDAIDAFCREFECLFSRLAARAAFQQYQISPLLPREQWERTVRLDSHGKELVRYVAELRLGPGLGPDRSVRLIAATEDPSRLQAESTWYMATNIPVAEASPAEVYDHYRLRDWIEHYYKPAEHELGWADFQVRPEQAVVRHWFLVMLAFTFSLLAGAARSGTETASPAERPGGKSRGRIVWQATLRQVRRWLCPWARLHLYWQTWSTAPPPPELAALLDHLAHSRPLGAPT